MKTEELTGDALDWAVAKCEGFEIVAVKNGRATFLDHADDGALNEMPINYSTDWAQGGRIIEREKIEVFIEDECWKAYSSNSLPKNFDGKTPLIAAMRCFVASVFGDEIEIPDELMEAV